MRKKYKTVIFAAIHQTASGLYEAGIVDQTTLQRFDASCLRPVENRGNRTKIRAIEEDGQDVAAVE